MMFKVIYFNNLIDDDKHLKGIISSKDFQVDNVTTCFDFINSISRTYYSIAIISYDFEDVNVDLLINAIKSLCSGIRIVAFYRSDMKVKNNLLCSNSDINIEYDNASQTPLVILEKFMNNVYRELQTYIYTLTQKVSL